MTEKISEPSSDAARSAQDFIATQPKLDINKVPFLLRPSQINVHGFLLSFICFIL